MSRVALLSCLCLVCSDVQLFAAKAPSKTSTVPAAPSNLSASGVSSTQVRLTWTDNANNESGFLVQRAASAAGPFTQIATAGVNSTSYTDGSLAAGTTYYYEVAAYNSKGASAFIGPVSATTLAPTCTYSISPPSASYTSSPGSGSVTVTSPTGCSWTASSGASWITITSGTSGSGNGTVNYSVAANSATTSRSATLTVAGQTVTITQAAAPCTYSISPASGSYVYSGGTGSISVSTSGNCSWSASSGASWVTITAGASGTGNGTVTFSVVSNATVNARSTVLTVAGQTFSISQDGMPCTYSISPTARAFTYTGGTGIVNVSNTIGCGWTAVSGAAWITITAGASGSGNGTVSYSVATNTSTVALSGTISVAGQIFTVSQDAGPCAYSISPTSGAYSNNGGTGSISVTTSANCAWSSSSPVSWVTITAGASGTGNGTVSFSVTSNTTPNFRATMLTVAGQTYSITQNGTPCTYSISPGSASFTASGGSGSVSVTTGTGCSWTASSGASWITITAGASGSGNGTVNYSVNPNTTTNSLSGTMTIAGQTFSVGQAGVPVDSTPPSVSLTAPSGGSTVSGTISLTASASDNVAVAKVEFYADAGVLVGTSTASPYSVSENTTGLANGSHSFYAKAYDAAGNSTTSASSSVTVSNVAPGQLQWVRNMVATTQVLPNGVATDYANNAIVTGGFSGAADFGAGTMNAAGSLSIFLAKYRSNGSCLWARTFGAFGSDRAESVAVDSQNNIIVTGGFAFAVDFGGTILTANDPSQLGQSDIFVAKYAPNGSLVWAIRFGGTSGDIGKAVAVDTNDNIYVGASFYGNADFGGTTLASTAGANSIAIVKLAPTGATLWARKYGTSSFNDMPNSIVVDSGGDLGVTGTSTGASDVGAGLGVGGLFVAKYSGADGTCKWARALGDGTGYGIASDPNTGNVFVTGSSPGTLDYGGGALSGGFFVAAYSPAGAYLWAKAFGAAGDYGLSVAVEKSGALAITGQSSSAINFGGGLTFSGGNMAWYVASYNVSGNNLPTYRWAKRASTSSVGTGAIYDSAGHLLVNGSFSGTVDFGGAALSTTALDNGFLAQYSK